MKKSYIGVIIVVVIVILGVVIMYAKPGAEEDTQNTSQVSPPPAAVISETPMVPPPPTVTPPPPIVIPPPPAKGVFSGGEDIEGNDVQVEQITYDGSSFTPSTLKIKAGDIVVFKNTSTSSFWPASNPHPAHTLYPEFDAKQGIAAGKTYQFKFTKTGTWGFHDHLNASAKGTITVTN